MKGLDQLDAVIRNLEQLKESLEVSTAPFFKDNEVRYLAIARHVSHQTLMVMRPDEQDAAEWKEHVDDFCDLVFSRSLPAGLEILYAGRTGAAKEASGVASYTAINYEDVLAWVQAGPENGGKDITAIESNRGRRSEQIAYDVHQAILQHRLGTERKDYSRITERLEDWVNSRVLGGDMGPMLDAVLDAWTTVLEPVIARDFERWVDRTMKRAMR